MINNVERKTSQGSESQMVGKVVITSEVSIYGLGTHSGIGEEWADDEEPELNRADCDAREGRCLAG